MLSFTYNFIKLVFAWFRFEICFIFDKNSSPRNWITIAILYYNNWRVGIPTLDGFRLAKTGQCETLQKIPIEPLSSPSSPVIQVFVTEWEDLSYTQQMSEFPRENWFCLFCIDWSVVKEWFSCQYSISSKDVYLFPN